MAQETFIEKQEESISIHIFAVSAAMVGVCITAISILSIQTALRHVETLCDEILSIDSILFLGSCILSYLAMRIKNRKQRLLLEKTADIVFVIALFLIAVATFIVARELI